MIRNALWSAGGAAALLATAPAFAQTSDVLINFQLDVKSGCEINSGNATALLDFGVKQAGSTSAMIDAQTAAGAISVLCNISSTVATFEIGKGQNDGVGNLRFLNNPLVVAGGAGAQIAYRLYATPGRTPASEYVPDGTKIPVNGGVITAGAPFEITIYGRIESGDAKMAVTGTYTDQAAGTLTF